MLRLSRRAVKRDFVGWTARLRNGQRSITCPTLLGCSNRGGGDGTKPNEPRVPSRVGIRDSGRVVVLGSIEARYTDELARLEQSHTSGWAKERLRQQLESRRKSAREPHVLKLAELRRRLLAETLCGTRH